MVWYWTEGGKIYGSKEASDALHARLLAAQGQPGEDSHRSSRAVDVPMGHHRFHLGRLARVGEVSPLTTTWEDMALAILLGDSRTSRQPQVVLDREDERALNRKAGIMAAIFVLGVALAGVAIFQHFGWFPFSP